MWTMRSFGFKNALLAGLFAVGVSACNHHVANGNGDGGDDMSAGDAGPLVVDFAMACATSSAKAELAPLDILIILDNSASMDYEGKWTAVKLAMKSFIANPAAIGLGLGIQYYPLRATCNIDDYAMPAVGIEVLPAGASDITTSLESRQMNGGTPIVPSFEGVFSYLKNWATTHPTHKVVMVLASDGVPDDSCIAPTDLGLPNSLANATQLAMDAYTSTPQVSTFVIGVGDQTSGLQSIATAGGGTAIFVDTNSDIQGAFLSALNSIRGNALSCQFPIPQQAADAGALDFNAVNVVYTPAPGDQSTSLVYVGDSSQCAAAGGNGWYYDNPSNPQTVILCGGACATATASTTGRVDVVFGCKTVIL